MFVGHYGPAYAANVARRTIPLWVLFIAVQLLDVWWAFFVLLGIEKVRIVPGITATSPFDLYYMPYTHSLIGSVIWSIGAGLLYYLFRTRDGRIAAAIVGAAVFSHWVLDLLVHRPDLSMYDDTLKVGLGLWNYPIPAILLELAVLFGGIFLYLRTTRAITPFGRYGMVIFGVAMAIIQSIAFFGPPPVSVKANAVTTLALYAIFTSAVWWLEKQRIPAAAT